MASLPGLIAGSYRGISFHVADTATEPGRRIVEYMFPGVDAAAYDDFGLLPTRVMVEALVVGDDYRQRAIALEAAFNLPGPGLLMHPWLGPMQVILDERPAQISFSDRQLGIARVSVSFKRMAIGGGFASAASGLVGAIAGLTGAASALSIAVGTNILSVAQSYATTRATRLLSSALSSLTTPIGSGRALNVMRAALSVTLPASPAAFNTLLQTVAAPIAEAQIEAAVAPAAEAPATVETTSIGLMTLGMMLFDALAAYDGPADPDRALLAAGSAHVLAAVSEQSRFAPYASRREALSWRGKITDAVETLGSKLEVISAAGLVGTSTALARASRDLQAAVIADISETVGRLPDVLTFKAAGGLDAWLLAAHVFGDDPARMEAGYADIIARNGPRHPASLPAGPIEVLE